MNGNLKKKIRGVCLDHLKEVFYNENMLSLPNRHKYSVVCNSVSLGWFIFLAVNEWRAVLGAVLWSWQGSLSQNRQTQPQCGTVQTVVGHSVFSISLKTQPHSDCGLAISHDALLCPVWVNLLVRPRGWDKERASLSLAFSLLNTFRLSLALFH